MDGHTLLASFAATIFASSALGQTYLVPPPSGSDDAPVIQGILDAAELWLVQNPTAGPAIVSFAAGKTYHLKSFPDLGPFALQVRGKPVGTDRMILAGNGATLLHGMLTGETLGIRSSHKVSVENMKFDRSPRPFMEGTVSSLNGTQIDVKFLRGLQPGSFPLPIADQWGWILDPAIPGRPKTGSRTHYRFTSVAPSPTGNNVLRFDLAPGYSASDFVPGDRFTYQYREGGNNIQVYASTDTVIRNVTTFAAGSMFVNAAQSNGLVIDQCSALIPDGYWRSINGDGFHIKCSTGVSITNNYLEGLSDDGINLTTVTQFSVTGNLFVNKRRHAILLDANDPLPQSPNPCLPNNSTNGTIALNAATGNGCSFLAHDGGDYATVAIFSNNPVLNNVTRDVTLNRRLRLVSGAAATLAIRADQGANGIWNAGDTVYLASVLGGTEFEWDVQDRLGANGIDNPEHLIAQRAARDQGVWLYLASALAAPVSGTPVTLGAPMPSSNPSEQKWRVEEVAGPGVIRIYLEGTANPRLYLSAATTGVPVPGTPLQLRVLDPLDRNQVWLAQSIED